MDDVGFVVVIVRVGNNAMEYVCIHKAISQIVGVEKERTNIMIK